MRARYLAVDDTPEGRALVAHLAPVYGATLVDGRVVAKVRSEEVPAGTEDLGTDAADVREVCEVVEVFP